MSMIHQMLSIADNARIDHEAGHPAASAPFCGRDLAPVRRAVARGWLEETSRGRCAWGVEVWAKITPAGRAELARHRGE